MLPYNCVGGKWMAMNMKSDINWEYTYLYSYTREVCGHYEHRQEQAHQQYISNHPHPKACFVFSLCRRTNRGQKIHVYTTTSYISKGCAGGLWDMQLMDYRSHCTALRCWLLWLLLNVIIFQMRKEMSMINIIFIARVSWLPTTHHPLCMINENKGILNGNCKSMTHVDCTLFKEWIF